MLYRLKEFEGILVKRGVTRKKKMQTTMNDTSLLIKSVRFAGLDGVRKSIIDISLSYCGIQQCSPLHNNGPEIRDTSYLHIILEGKGTLQIGDETYSLGKGDAFFIPSGTCAQYTADRYDPWHYMWVGFSGLMSLDIMTMAGFSTKCPVRHMGVVGAQMRSFIEGMIESYRLTYADEFTRNGYFFLFIGALIESYQGMAPVVDNHQYYLYAHQAYDYIMRNFAKKITISGIADIVGISRSHLFTCFKKTYQLSPKQFLDQVRMEHAASMLISKKLYISQIARNVGFDDELAFSKAFKSYFNHSPTDFRKLNHA